MSGERRNNGLDSGQKTVQHFYSGEQNYTSQPSLSLSGGDEKAVVDLRAAMSHMGTYTSQRIGSAVEAFLFNQAVSKAVGVIEEALRDLYVVANEAVTEQVPLFTVVSQSQEFQGLVGTDSELVKKIYGEKSGAPSVKGPSIIELVIEVIGKGEQEVRELRENWSENQQVEKARNSKDYEEALEIEQPQFNSNERDPASGSSKAVTIAKKMMEVLEGENGLVQLLNGMAPDASKKFKAAYDKALVNLGNTKIGNLTGLVTAAAACFAEVVDSAGSAIISTLCPYKEGIFARLAVSSSLLFAPACGDRIWHSVPKQIASILFNIPLAVLSLLEGLVRFVAAVTIGLLIWPFELCFARSTSYSFFMNTAKSSARSALAVISDLL